METFHRPPKYMRFGALGQENLWLSQLSLTGTSVKAKEAIDSNLSTWLILVNCLVLQNIVKNRFTSLCICFHQIFSEKYCCSLMSAINYIRVFFKVWPSKTQNGKPTLSFISHLKAFLKLFLHIVWLRSWYSLWLLFSICLLYLKGFSFLFVWGVCTTFLCVYQVHQAHLLARSLPQTLMQQSSRCHGNHQNMTEVLL